MPRLLGEDLVLARADGSYAKVMHTLARTDLLILDDWGLAPLGDRERRDLLELVEDRVGRRATLVTSQLPVDHWHEMIGEPTFGDAILDRLVHHAHRLTLTGGSLRRLPPPPPHPRRPVRLTPRPRPSPGDRHQPKRLIAMDRTR